MAKPDELTKDEMRTRELIAHRDRLEVELRAVRLQLSDLQNKCKHRHTFRSCSDELVCADCDKYLM